MVQLYTRYRGNCNCGRFRFELSLPVPIDTAIACTCSLCSKKGFLWLVPPLDGLEVIRDDGCLTEYTSQALRHKYCNYCGNGVTGEHLTGPLQGQFLVNVRLFQGVNPYDIEYTSGDEPPAQHLFACHCGRVQAELLTSITEHELKEDNCSSCVRGAYIGVYPNRENVRIYGREHGREYYGLRAELTDRKWGSAVSCKTCGIHVFTNIWGPPLSTFDKVRPERKALVLEVYYKNIKLLPLNVRSMEDFEKHILVFPS
ncbi:glutathione-dependent formaldehyde-activating enzyme [Xylariales sp. PMI_506]|nr:glutathione-dependent formaldehyde-activating enzyme [Xylariales sp. PMI_506]